MDNKKIPANAPVKAQAKPPVKAPAKPTTKQPAKAPAKPASQTVKPQTKQQANQKNTKPKKQKKSKSGTPYLLILLIPFLLIGFAMVGALYVLGIYYYSTYQTSDPISYADLRPTQFVTHIYDYSGNPLDTLHGEENREYAPLVNMPDSLKNAVVAMEDQRFYEHPGVDFEGVLRAVYVNFKEQSLREGASTITQQLVKNNLLRDTSTTLKRKVEEQCVAFKLEKDLTNKLGTKKAAKDYILEQYLNSVNLAHGINGVKLAAKYYYGKELMELTLAESASIAALIKNPVNFSPKSFPEKNWERAKTVLHRMMEQQYITYNEYLLAVDEKIYNQTEHLIEDDSAKIHSYFVDQVINDVARDFMFSTGVDEKTAYNLVYSGGLSIYTTFDPEIQRIVDEAMNDGSLYPAANGGVSVNITFETEQGIVRKNSFVNNDSEADAYIISQRQHLSESGYTIENESVQKVEQPQGAFAIIDYKTGHVPAVGAGRGEKQYNLAFNRATQAKRQPGSCFKVLAAYLPAIETGVLSPTSLIDDSPYTIDGYTPNNYDFRFRGKIPVRTAIRDSINVAAVKTLVSVGYDTAFEYLKRLGFTTLIESRTAEDGRVYTDLGPALALGGLTDGVTPLELAGAFGAIANKGMYNKPIFYTKVIAHDGTILLENITEPTEVVKSSTADALTDMMKDVVTRGTGTEARFRRINVEIAGKTGTSTDDKDLTFGGYTPFYAAAVWQGYDIPKELKYSRNYHLALWRTIMERVHELKGFTSGSFDISGDLYKAVESSGNDYRAPSSGVQNNSGTPARNQYQTQNQRAQTQTPNTVNQREETPAPPAQEIREESPVEVPPAENFAPPQTNSPLYGVPAENNAPQTPPPQDTTGLPSIYDR